MFKNSKLVSSVLVLTLLASFTTLNALDANTTANATVSTNTTAKNETANPNNTTNTTTPPPQPPAAKCDPNCVASTCSNGTCGSCNSGFLLEQKEKRRCIKCPSNCDLCLRDNICEKCKDVAALSVQNDKGESQCIVCNSAAGIPNCKSCDICPFCKNPLECLECNSGFYLFQWQQCIATVVKGNCAQFIESKNQCVKCASGYFLNSKGECAKCDIANCDVCEGTFCKKCSVGKVMTKSSTGGIACVDDSANTPCDIANCNSCDKTQWNHICNTCNANFQLLKDLTDPQDPGKCFTCSSTYNCAKCRFNAPDACETCATNFWKILNSYNNNTSPAASEIGLCATACPSGVKFPNSDITIAYYQLASSKTCIPCPYGWSSCNIVNGKYVLNGTCAAGFIENGTGDNKGCVPCGKGCSVCSTTSNNTCTTCDSNNYKDAQGKCSWRYDFSNETGKYFDKQSNTSVACPQPNCLQCYGPNTNDCYSCSAGFGMKQTKTATSQSQTCTACPADCGECRFNGDGTSQCFACSAGKVGQWSKADVLSCNVNCPAGYYPLIDSVAWGNKQLAALLNKNLTEVKDKLSTFDDPITNALFAAYKLITPKAIDSTATSLTVFHKVSADGKPVVYSSLDATPIKFNTATNKWEYNYNGTKSDVTMSCEMCTFNCKVCPESLPKFIFTNGTSLCLTRCPQNYVVTVSTTDGNICSIPNDKLVVEAYVNSAPADGIQDFLNPINASVKTLNAQQITNVTWKIKNAKSLLNANLSETDIIGNISANVNLTASILIIPVTNFQKYPMTQLVLEVTAQNSNSTAVSSAQLFISLSNLLSKFVVTPSSGISGETKFNAEYEIKAEFATLLGTRKVNSILMCYPDKSNTTASATRRLQTANSTSTSNSSLQVEITKPDNSQNQSNPGNPDQNGPPVNNQPQDPIIKPKNDVGNANAGFDPNSGKNEAEQKQLDNQKQVGEADKSTLRDIFDRFKYIQQFSDGVKGNISFVAPYSATKQVYTCMIYFEFAKGGEIPFNEIRDSAVITVEGTTKSAKDIFSQLNNQKGGSTSSDFGNEANLLSSAFLGSAIVNSNSTPTEIGICDKNGTNSICCPPDNLCSGNGACVKADQSGLVSNSNSSSSSATVFNKRFVCKCNTGFAGIKCEMNSTVYAQCTTTFQNLLNKYQNVNDLDTEDKVISYLSTLQTLAKTCVKNYNSIKGLLTKICETFKKCKTEACIELGIGAISDIASATTYLSDPVFIPGFDGNETLSADQLSVAQINKKRFLSDLDKCFDNLLATGADISFNNTNVTSKVYKKGTITSLISERNTNATGSFNSSCNDITGKTESSCDISIPDNFTTGNGIVRYQITPQSRDEYASFEGGSSLISDAVTITISKNGTVMEIVKSDNAFCMEMKNLNPTSCAYMDLATGAVKNDGSTVNGTCTKLTGDCVRCCFTHLTTFVLTESKGVNNQAGTLSYSFIVSVVSAMWVLILAGMFM